jgi:hypothetical protein
MRKRSVFVISTLWLAGGVAVLLMQACDRSSSGGSDTVAISAATSKSMASRVSAMGAATPASAGMESRAQMPTDQAIGPTPTASPAVANARDARAERSFTSALLPSGVDPSGAMLVRHGQASVEVKHVDDAVTKVRQTAAQFGGFVANTSFRGGRDEQRAATLEIRVPTGQFDALVAALGGLGRVESVSAAAEDVADEYVDLGARVVNARRVEARLIEMLAARTGKLSEVLTVEQELRRVREEIERYDARLKWLERRTALSSLDVSMHEPLPLIERQPGPGPLAEAFAEAWARAIGVLAWCIAMLGVLLPVLAIGLGVAVLARRVLRPGTPPGVSGA